ncbi:nucleoside transporter [Halioxenophilus sp. WMMB6]|uniref:purine-cytosine permease family protein n=1 Tax=Halioxenophilus sp. WMMB6 TaxID=3073815 RepID=UPI00295E44B5|nr:nucleoside transporter [Halioxenophilus sp. WMMB6]
MSTSEFDRAPVPPSHLQPARHFAASYAGEHAAGTEFVIGATFVAWGVGTMDILWGLLLGNLLAVLSWALICAPIAVDTRLTLYAYLEKIAGKGMVRLYALVNGVMFCVLAGAMITVSASAVRILFDLPAQVHWYPTSAGFVLVAVAVGLVVAAVATKGFTLVAKFAEVCAPWMVLMFLVGGIALLPLLAEATPGVDGVGSWADFRRIADTHIWRDSQGELGFWHVTAFAWICNLAMHGGLADMTILRFARKSQYGYFSALGMFIGHFMAWVCAGIMGAGAALLLTTPINQLDAGAVAFQALGAAGILAVIIAGWTTANPTIYRAGLAFQSLKPSLSREKVTAVTGVITTLIACFPFVFTKLLDFVGLMGLTLAPVGAIIVTEHWLFPCIGLTRYWTSYSQRFINWPALITWLAALLFAFALNQAGVHLFFLLLPAWAFTMLAYTLLARAFGAKVKHSAAMLGGQAAEAGRKQREANYLAHLKQHQHTPADSGRNLFGFASMALLLLCLALALLTFSHSIDFNHFHRYLAWATFSYFAAALLWLWEQNRRDQQLARAGSSEETNPA